MDERAVSALVRELGVAPLVARVLVGRGKDDVDVARRFLEPSLDQLSDPLLFLGADVAIERLLRALREKQKIVVFGDFDVDGVTGTSLAFRTLSELGADVEFFLPKRLVHGYGLSKKVLPDLLARRPALVLTVDCGIRSVEEVADLAREGVDTVITDHHEPGPVLPPAVAVVDPKQAGCPYPDKRLAGVGVMFQLMRGLVARLEHEVELSQHLDLVALGTVADVVPLDGENRALVSAGLAVLNRRAKVGVMALVMASEIEDRLESWHLAYLLGPRINAAGRLGDAEQAVRLFTVEDTAVANDLARELDAENRRRQEISATTLEQALEAIDRGVAGDHPDGIVLASNSWHPGVIGIATAKLVERYHRPSALIAMQGDEGRGSVRSIRGVDVCEVLEGCEDLLVQYGGHAMAAGLTIRRENVADFRARFASGVAQRLTDQNSVPLLKIDAELGIDEIDLDLVEQLDRLAPFGCGNARPTFLLRGARSVGRPRVVGRGHLKMSVRRDEGGLDCIGFDLGGRLDDGRLPDGPLDLVGHVAVNEWNGRRSVQLQLADLRESRP
jgi:single-stranded-DNA-specific exonuclease